MKLILSEKKDYRELTHCRLCGGDFEHESLNLGSTGLANELYLDSFSAKQADKFPLVLVICKKCKHIQLRDVVSPERLFGNYVYESGFSSSFHKHFEELAQYLCDLRIPNKHVLEIGSNDGLLLGKLAEKGVVAVGIEPSKLLADKSNKSGLKTLHGFWNRELKDEIVNTFGQPGVVVANNVFAHIEDMRTATSLISEVLAPDGFFVFEVSYFGDVFEKNLFDTIYHEHMSYHTLIPLIAFFNEFNLKVVDVLRIPIHGGSIRVTVKKNLSSNESGSIKSLVKYEETLHLNQDKILIELGNKIQMKKREVSIFLDNLNQKSFIFGFAAPAKLVTFLSVMQIDDLNLQGIIDDNPSKQNKFLPISGAKIVSMDEIIPLINKSDSHDICCLVFAWNIGPELLDKLRAKFPKGMKAIQFMPNFSSVEL